MRKAMFFILIAIFAAAGLMTQGAIAQEAKPPKTTASAKQVRWHGVIVRINEKMSTLEVRKGGIVRTIYYDDSTQWTEMNKPSQMSAFKEGSNVICLGKSDEKGNVHATRVDLRTPKVL